MKATLTGGIAPVEIEIPEATAPPPDPTPRQALTSARAKLTGKQRGSAQVTNRVDLTAPEVGILLHGLNLYDEKLRVMEILRGER